MKNEDRKELETSNDEKGLELSDALLEDVNGGGLHHRKRHVTKPDWSEVDPEDGSAGVTYTW